MDEVYFEEQIYGVLDSLGIEIVNEGDNDFQVMCPIHGNTNTAAMSVSHEGLVFCFNPMCGFSGTIVDLVEEVTGENRMQAMILLSKFKKNVSMTEIMRKKLNKPPVYSVFPDDVINRLVKQMPNSAGEEYMHGRGFEDDTLAFFEVGYSELRNSIVVPVHAPDGIPMGVVSRRLDRKGFHLKKGMKASHTLWNYHRSGGDSLKMVEASFDAMSIYQAGYNDVVATLMGHLSDHQKQLIMMRFQEVVIMTDNDIAGIKLGMKIADKLSGISIKWGWYGESRFPDLHLENGEPVKDMNDLIDRPDCIQQMIENAVPNYKVNLDKLLQNCYNNSTQ